MFGTSGLMDQWHQRLFAGYWETLFICQKVIYKYIYNGVSKFILKKPRKTFGCWKNKVTTMPPTLPILISPQFGFACWWLLNKHREPPIIPISYRIFAAIVPRLTLSVSYRRCSLPLLPVRGRVKNGIEEYGWFSTENYWDTHTMLFCASLATWSENIKAWGYVNQNRITLFRGKINSETLVF